MALPGSCSARTRGRRTQPTNPCRCPIPKQLKLIVNSKGVFEDVFVLVSVSKKGIQNPMTTHYPDRPDHVQFFIYFSSQCDVETTLSFLDIISGTNFPLVYSAPVFPNYYLHCIISGISPRASHYTADLLLEVGVSELHDVLALARAGVSVAAAPTTTLTIQTRYLHQNNQRSLSSLGLIQSISSVVNVLLWGQNICWICICIKYI